MEQELEGGAGQQIAEEEEERVAGGPARQLSSAHSLRAHRLFVACQQELQELHQVRSFCAQVL